MEIHRVLIVHRKSLYQLYIQEHKERSVQRAIRRRDPAALAMKQSHDAHARALAKVAEVLRRLGIEHDARWRAQVRSSSTKSFDLVISLGGDGTLLDASHRVLDSTPLLGINSDPSRSVGALCYGGPDRLSGVLRGLLDGKIRPAPINRMRIRVDGKEILGPTLNDVLFAHECPAGLTRFDRAIVPTADALDVHPGRRPDPFVHFRGSGLWVSTAIGSTAAIRSAGGRAMSPRSRRLQFLVREPYVPPGDRPPPGVHGWVDAGEALVLINRLRRGMLWADGVHRNLGLSYAQQVVLDNHPVPLRLVLDR